MTIMAAQLAVVATLCFFLLSSSADTSTTEEDGSWAALLEKMNKTMLYEFQERAAALQTKITDAEKLEALRAARFSKPQLRGTPTIPTIFPNSTAAAASLDFDNNSLEDISSKLTAFSQEEEQHSISVATYNLFWWCVSDKYYKCPRNSNGQGFSQLYSRIRQNGPYDLIGFQECDNVGQVLGGSGLAGFGHSGGDSGLGMAWNTGRFEVIEGPNFVQVASDRYGARKIHWVRLRQMAGGRVIFFANAHGPLDQCWGGQGQVVGDSYQRAIAENKKPDDVVIFTGDFNCGGQHGRDTIDKLTQFYADDAVDNSFGGADHVFATKGIRVLESHSTDGTPSDHELLKVRLVVP